MPSIQELEQMLTAIGWNLKSVKEPTTSSNGRFVATIEPPDGGQAITRDGDTAERAMGNALMFAQRRNGIRAYASLHPKLASWNTPWHEQLENIAQDYAKAPVWDEKAIQAWQALAKESKLQSDAIRNQLRIQETDEPHPYAHHGEMIHDVHHNGRLSVSRAHSEHPVWSRDDLVNFRIAHDVLGHSQTGGDYGWNGEVKAVEAHMPMLSPLARRALFSETLGKTAYAIRNGSHGYGPQKIALLEDHLGPTEKMNGEHVFVPHGKLVYPQNVLEPGAGSVGFQQHPETGIWQATSSVKRSDNVGAWTPPHTMTSLEMAPRSVYSSIEPSPEYPDILPGTKADPNMYASTPGQFVKPDITPAGAPHDYLLRGNMEENVGKFDQPEDPFISLSPEEQRKTIRNAFAIVILSPKKSLTWNAAHYQAIKDLDSSASSADLFNAIMKERNYHNTFRAEGKARDMFDMEGLSPAGMNRANHDRTVKKLHDYILRTTGHSDAKAWELAKKTIMEMYNQIEPHAMISIEKENEMRQQAIDPATQEVELNKAGRPNTKREIEPNGMRLRLKTWEMVNAWLDSVMSGYKIPKKNPELAPEPQPLGGGLPVQMARAINGWFEKTAVEGGPNETTGADIKGRYGGVMFDHLEAISRLSQPVLEQMRQYAVKDITEDGGKGFIFRAGCVALNVPGIGPKTASFAWLLIVPQSSELGIIDTHAARGLGFEDEKALNDRTYYIAERMQRAAKDATGYADVPLGKYHWGFWDMLRTPGVSSDHRMLRPRNPLPWDDPSIYHAADEIVSRAGQPLFHGHPAFEAGRPLMEGVKSAAEAELRTKMLPTHYAQGLLPEQPPEEYRAEPSWKMMNRYTTPPWIDPKTNRPYPDAMIPFEAPSVRAASLGWKESIGWEDRANELQDQIDPQQYLEESEGNSVAAQHLLSHDLKQQYGYDDLSAWAVAGELIRRHEPQRGTTDMSEFENAGVADHTPVDYHGWGPTEEYPEDFNPAAQGWKPSEDQSQFDRQKTEELRMQNDLPPFPDPEGDTVPPGVPFPEEYQRQLRKYKMPYDPNDPRTAAFMPTDPRSPHGGYANDDDVVCNHCIQRTRSDKGICEKCGEPLTGNEHPIIAGDADHDMRVQHSEWMDKTFGPGHHDTYPRAASQKLAWPDPSQKYQPGGWSALPHKNEEGFDICPICGESLIPGKHPRDVCPNANYRRISKDYGWTEA